MFFPAALSATACRCDADRNALEKMPHVFERFFRVNSSRHDSALHSGLGLAISKAIVEAHGGALDASNPPGKGTTFRMQLPASGVCPS